MAIFLRQSHLIKPARWGSFADVMYAVQKNSETIYGVDYKTNALIMPGFWGFPCIDFSGKQNHGTPVDGVSYHSEGLDFDGNGYVIAPGFDNWTEQTVSVWFKTPGSSDDYARVIEKGYNNEWTITFNNPYIVHKLVIQYGDNIDLITSTDDLDDNEQHLATLIINSSELVSLYIDGIFDKSADGSANSPAKTGDVFIGGTPGAPDASAFNGIIPEVRISKAAHTANQIALFHALPYGLYQPANRPIYFFSKVTSLTVTLPCITAEISGQQASSLNVTLPMITADILGGGGGFLDATLPMITAEIEGRESQSGDLTATLPCITAEILGGGGGFLDATLPMITAEMRGGALLEATLPCITAGIEGKAGTVGEIDVTLPIIVADIEGKVEMLGDINAILPAIRAYMSGKTGKVGSIDVALPMIEAALTSYQEVTGGLNATLPMITARIVGTPDRFATCTPLRFTEPI